MKSLSRISPPLAIAAIVAGLVISSGRVASADEASAAEVRVKPISCAQQGTQAGLLEPAATRLAQTDLCPEGHTCITYSCGGDSDTVVCCPRGFPYLSHCDCRCYEASPACDSYTRCSQP